MSMTNIDIKPRWLRVIATAFYVFAALLAATALLGLVDLWVSDGPDWNIADKFGDAVMWFYVGALHSTIARLREARCANLADEIASESTSVRKFLERYSR